MNEIIKIINQWDPINFFPFAPKDEYLPEIKKIIHFIKEQKQLTEIELGQYINKTFINNYGEDVYASDLLKCNEIARLILSIKHLDSYL